MKNGKIKSQRAEMRWRAITVAFLLSLLTVAGCKKEAPAALIPETPQMFAAPSEAADALYKASKAGDSNAMLAIFGSGAKEVVFSGDPVQDRRGMEYFAANYEEMHRWSKLEHGLLLLNFGAENYPFPFPLRKDSSGKWSFDVDSGKKELLARRVGRNELTTISALYALADAQEQYFQQKHDDEKEHQYAMHFISHEGKQDGLYWPVKEGEPESPLGPLVAKASAEGYSQEKPEPFHGYYYRMLREQGPHAQGGAKSYSKDGKMTGGYAFLAWPAEYRNSGVMTFLIDREGVVYQKDLGEKTADLAKAITAYDPDETWEKVE
jgi:Protein of unknown function (DUF2950)